MWNGSLHGKSTSRPGRQPHVHRSELYALKNRNSVDRPETLHPTYNRVRCQGPPSRLGEPARRENKRHGDTGGVRIEVVGTVALLPQNELVRWKRH